MQLSVSVYLPVSFYVHMEILDVININIGPYFVYWHAHYMGILFCFLGFQSKVRLRGNSSAGYLEEEKSLFRGKVAFPRESSLFRGKVHFSSEKFTLRRESALFQGKVNFTEGKFTFPP